jgi:ubiquinone/menaquinone biosynthesis C-methylase UbiE
LREEDTVHYWDRKWALSTQRLKERVRLDGSDGEKEFEREVLKVAVGKRLLDVGCGTGAFTLRVGKRVNKAIGIDISRIALGYAIDSRRKWKSRNVEFLFAKASGIPFRSNSFDVVYSRRGPGSLSVRTLSEAYRVLKPGGLFMEITIGERDKQNIAKIFGRGQMLGIRGQVSSLKKKVLKRVGFKKIVARDYLGTEIFRTMDNLVIRMRTAPIIPRFDPQRDRQYLEQVGRECRTDRGIETPVHRVLLVARK